MLNESNLLSAISRPYCGYFSSLSEKAAVLMEALIQNHGFVDGNKRSAVFLSLTMIRLSGFDVLPLNPKDDVDLQIEDMAVALAEGRINSEDICAWLTPRLKPI